jgi:hypothetical protein
VPVWKVRAVYIYVTLCGKKSSIGAGKESKSGINVCLIPVWKKSDL